MNQKGSLSYVCINCGLKVSELYKTYSPTVLKLSTCENCGEISDKYIEYDPVIIMIDLVLLQKQAYRHFLFNTEFKNHLKLAILVQLMEAYAEWMFHFSRNTDTKHDIDAHTSFSRQNDLQFYMIFLKILFSTIVYNISVIFSRLQIFNVLVNFSNSVFKFSTNHVNGFV
ncbi:ACAT-related protein required for viability 1 [Carabus blaptoides fortunei]